MAFNPMMNQGNPLLFHQESKVKEISNVYSSLEFSESASISRDEGSLILTNARIIFINRQDDLWYRNYALHLDLISDDHFTDIDGKILFQGCIAPYHIFMPSQGRFTIEMPRQESFEFKGKFQNFMRQIKIAKSRSALQNINEGNQAFIDPYNPDVLQVVERPEKKTNA